MNSDMNFVNYLLNMSHLLHFRKYQILNFDLAKNPISVVREKAQCVCVGKSGKYQLPTGIDGKIYKK